MEQPNQSVADIPAVQEAISSLSISDPNPFRAARAPGARRLYEALKDAPISEMVLRPVAMPVTTAPIEQLTPIFEHLQLGKPAAGVAFPRGATFTDGRLDMCKQVVGPEYIGDLTRAVCKGGEQSDLSHFLIGNNVVGNCGALEISKMVEDQNAPRLKTLYLAGNKFDFEGIKHLSSGLSRDGSVRSLWLKRNPLGPKSGAILAEMLRNNTTLETLDLVNTGLLDDGVAALFEGLVHNRTLRTLYLDANGLGPKAAAAMGQYFSTLAERKVKGLTGLFLGINRLGCNGASVLADGIARYGRLERLDVGANRIEETGLASILAATKASPNMCYLGLGIYKSASDMGELPNWFGDTGAEMICDHIAATRGPIAIELKDAHIGPDGLALLGDVLETETDICELSAVQYNLRQPALFHRIERYLKRNVATKFNMDLSAFRNGPLRTIKHGPNIDDIASIYRNVM